VSSVRCRDGRSLRSPRGAGGSAARARGDRSPRRSDGEPLAPLGSTTSEHAPTALRSHPGHEAMLTLARALLGLIGPLRHGCVPFPRSMIAFGALHTRTAGVSPACAYDFRWPISLIRDSTVPRGGRSNVARGQGGAPDATPSHAVGRNDRSNGSGKPRRPVHRSPRWRVAARRLDGTLPRRIGRCYSGATPTPDSQTGTRLGAWQDQHHPTRRRRRSFRREPD
jgi:hypothetical protein